MTYEGITVSEIMKATGFTESAIRSWLSRHSIKPLSDGAIYPTDTLEKIRDTKRGRPSKKPDDADKK
jgi:hypothetical protein